MRDSAMLLQDSINVFVREFRAQIGTAHRIMMAARRTGFTLVDMPHGIGRPYGTASVASRRLNPKVIKHTRLKDFSVGNAIQRHTTSKDQVFAPSQTPRSTS
jgi:hypothetical protein